MKRFRCLSHTLYEGRMLTGQVMPERKGLTCEGELFCGVGAGLAHGWERR
jgi:hypothetical protein